MNRARILVRTINPAQATSGNFSITATGIRSPSWDGPNEEMLSVRVSKSQRARELHEREGTADEQSYLERIQN